MLQEKSCHPSSLAETRHMATLQVKVPLGCQVPAGRSKDPELLLDILGSGRQVTFLGIGHPNHDPVLVSRMGLDQFGGGLTPGPMIVEDGWPFAIRTVVLGKNNLHAFRKLGKSKFESLGSTARPIQTRGENKQERERGLGPHGSSNDGRASDSSAAMPGGNVHLSNNDGRGSDPVVSVPRA